MSIGDSFLDVTRNFTNFKSKLATLLLLYDVINLVYNLIVHFASFLATQDKLKENKLLVGRGLSGGGWTSTLAWQTWNK